MSDNEKYLVAVFPTDKIKTGAHRRYKELITKLSGRGYKVICFAPVNLFGNNIYRFKKITLNVNSIIPITIQLALQVYKNIEKSKMKRKCKIIIFGETTVLSGILLKKVIKSPLLLGVRTNVMEDRKLALEADESNNNLLKRSFNKLYLYFFSVYEKMMYKYSDIITVQSDLDKINVNKVNSNKKIIVIPNNMNVEWIENDEIKNINKSQEVKKIGFVGSLIKRKGVDVLLDSYNLLINRGYNLELHIAGEGPLKKELKTLKSTNNLSELYLYGHINNTMEFMKEIDLLVVPSLIDSFPNVIFEAWYVGTPAIGSSVGGILYQLEDRRLLFSPHNMLSLSEKIEECLDQVFYKEIRFLSQQRKKEFHFDWVASYEKVIKKL